MVLCGEEVELQQARPGRASGRGPVDGRAGGKLEVGRLQESEALGGPSCRIGGEWSLDQ